MLSPRVLRTRLLVLPALALALTACGGGGKDGGSSTAAAASPGASAGSSGAPGGAAAQVRAAGSKATAAGSSKFALTSTTAIGTQNVTFSGQGAFDYAKRVGQLTFTVPGSGGSGAGGTIEERLLGPDLFLTLPQMPGTFYRLKVADVVGTSLGSSTDPTAPLSALAGLQDVREVGKVDVRGVSTTHYSGTYDAQAAIDKAQGVTKTLLQATLGAVKLGRVPFDAYLDGEGRMVKFAQQLTLPATQATGGTPLTSNTVIELYDFGTTVTVTPPPASSVKDGKPLLDALKAAAPKTGSAPTAPAAPASPPTS